MQVDTTRFHAFSEINKIRSLSNVLPLLRISQEKKVANWIVDKNPAQLKFDFALWTAKAVRQLIYREFGRQLDLSTVRRYLRSWGMTPQRPKKKAIQQDDAAVQRWLETDYPALAERAKKEKATIFWEDETAVQQDTNWIRGYAPR